jgi:hypothetical protein
MTPKVLIYVDDGRIDIRHSRGVEVAVIVEGEEVELPDDWIGLLAHQHHSLPITVNREELPQKRALQCNSTSLAAPNTQVHHSTARLSEEELQELHEKEETTRRNVAANLMKHPYCFDCGDNHQPGACPAS